jgi:solute:Na+ symporter, SSS family
MKIKKMFLVACLIFLGISSSFAAERTTNKLLSEKPMPALPVKLTGYAIGVSNGTIIYAGGKSALGLTSSKAYVLTEGAKEWKAVDLKDSFANAAFTSDKKALYVVGGTPDAKAVRKISYTEGNLVEKELTPLPKEMPGAGIATDGKKLYILGSGNPNFMALSLKGKAAWKAQTECPVQGISDPSLVMQSPQGHSQLVMISAKIDGKSSNNAWIYRPVPTDGLNGAMTDQGWHDIADPTDYIAPNTASPSGQSHVVAYQNGKVYAYHLITDSWDESDILANSFESSVAVGYDRGAILIPTHAEESTLYADFKIVASPLGWVDWTIIAVYLLGMLGVGAYFMRKEKSTEDFFMGGHKIPWWAAGISIYATGTSAISYMAIPAKHFVTNLIYTLTPTLIGFFVAVFIVAKYMIPIVRRLRITTSYEYLKIRFNNSLRLLGSFLCIGMQLGGRMTIVLVLPSIAISAVTGLDPLYSVLIMGVVTVIYTTMGGMSAVIWTDVIQVVVLIGGAILALIMLIMHTDGGLSGFVAINMDYHKFRAIDWSFNLQAPVIWIFIIAAVVNAPGIINDQTQVQRALATPSVKDAKKSVIIMQIIVIPANFLFAFLGFALFAYYKSHPAGMSPAMTNEQAFPLYIVHGLPVGVTGLILAGLFAASMSTLSSSISSSATMIVNDFYKTIKKSASDRECLLLGKWLTCILGLVGTGLAMYLITLNISSMFDLWNQMLALFGGGIIGVFGLGMFTKRANSYGAWAGTLASILVTWFVKIAALPINAMVYTPMAIVTCLVVGYIVSILTGGPRKDQIEGMTVYTIDYKEANEAR